MDFGLKEIGITFMIGAFTILGFELVLHHLFGISLTGFYRDRLGLTNREKSEKDDDSFETMRIAVFIGLSFGIGVLTEDLSYKYVDTVESNSVRIMPEFIRKRLPEEIRNYSSDTATYDSRIEALFTDFDKNVVYNFDNRLKAETLAKDLAKGNAFLLADEINGLKLQNLILEEKCPISANDCSLPAEKISEIINQTYYLAKNRNYTQPNYYDELKKIESRRDFSRSLALISFFYLFITFIFLPIAFIYAICQNKIKKWKLNKIQLEEAKKIAVELKQNPEGLCNQNTEIPFILILSIKKWIKRSRKPLYTILILSSICFFSIWAFERELDEFHKRVFGYYSSTLLEEKKAEQKQLEFEKNKQILEAQKASLPK
jgi:hypothetical protein